MLRAFALIWQPIPLGVSGNGPEIHATTCRMLGATSAINRMAVRTCDGGPTRKFQHRRLQKQALRRA
eukprot:5035760-Pyramimonas_sp.AAC.1